MGTTLVLPVPETLLAVYVVPSPTADVDPEAVLRDGLGILADDRLRDLVGQLLGTPLLQIVAVDAADAPPPPYELLAAFGATPEALDQLRGAAVHLLVQAHFRPGWPPMHEWAARAAAAVLASALGQPIVDILVPRVLPADAALRSLPDEHGQFRLADWVLVPCSAGRRGLLFTTKGLGRFGLPELQAEDVPPQLERPWAMAFTGLAQALVHGWFAVAGAPASGGSAAGDGVDGVDPSEGAPGPAPFVELDDVVPVSSDDIAIAYGRPPPEPRVEVAVRLLFDPTPDPGSDDFLTVAPPLDVGSSAGEFFAAVCAALFGASADEVRQPRDHSAMEAAMAAARAELPEVRARFLRGELLHARQLIVKYRLDVDGGNEYVWAFVTAWEDPARIVGTSANDAHHDPTVRVGRTVYVDAEAVVDWAVWVDGEGIVEGGATNAHLED